VAKNSRGYKSEKRKKEIARQKKQEEKRLRRLNKGTAEEAGEGIESDDAVEPGAEGFETDTAEVMADEEKEAERENA